MRYNHQYTKTPNFTFKELWDLQNAFLTQFIYPNNAAQAKSINSSLFAPEVCPTQHFHIARILSQPIDPGPRRYY